MNTKTYLLFLLTSFLGLSAQNNFEYWQQHVDYTMDVTMDVSSSAYSGTQQLVYYQ